MVRTSKLALGAVVVLVCGGIGAGYAGAIPGIVSPAQLPGPPPTALALIVGVLVLAAVVSGIMDRQAWTRAGESLGLTAGGSRFHSQPGKSGGSSIVGEPTLSGTAAGRPVRAWTYSTNRGGEGSSKTYTVVEAQLQQPVEWTATFGSDIEGAAPDHEIEAVQGRRVGDVGVRGGVPDEVAEAVVTGQVAEVVAGLEEPVTVGDVQSSAVSGMMDALDDADDSMGATFAKGMLSMADDGEDGLSRTVEVRTRGLVLDRDALRQRINAVTTVADAVDRASAR
jgi:hypothetical protein